ncbi:Uu.00g122840.m01.CDS01 [Anthostomella pinea]|uniref:Uu.00g122840.m01.CDS01 n=1 Tax=Anthostomella pinea TaxID=933095 RepID=A0AAI8YHC4_9PEZI|nr:Uu.00g122840.m01.CDS01 [Anthostomella pinea]
MSTRNPGMPEVAGLNPDRPPTRMELEELWDECDNITSQIEDFLRFHDLETPCPDAEEAYEIIKNLQWAIKYIHDTVKPALQNNIIRAPPSPSWGSKAYQYWKPEHGPSNMAQWGQIHGWLTQELRGALTDYRTWWRPAEGEALDPGPTNDQLQELLECSNERMEQSASIGNREWASKNIQNKIHKIRKNLHPYIEAVHRLMETEERTSETMGEYEVIRKVIAALKRRLDEYGRLYDYGRQDYSQSIERLKTMARENPLALGQPPENLRLAMNHRQFFQYFSPAEAQHEIPTEKRGEGNVVSFIPSLGWF